MTNEKKFTDWDKQECFLIEINKLFELWRLSWIPLKEVWESHLENPILSVRQVKSNDWINKSIRQTHNELRSKLPLLDKCVLMNHFDSLPCSFG